MNLTDRQRGFLYRAAELERQGMGIMAAPGFQAKMARKLEKNFLLDGGIWMSHEETGREGFGWRITRAGVDACNYPYPLPSMATPALGASR